MAQPLPALPPRTGPAEQAALNAAYGRLAAAAHLLPIKVTRFYADKLAAELAALGHTEGPLHRVVYPDAARLATRAPGEVADFVDDRSNMKTASRSIVQKYADRVLFLATPVCAAHCQYCFRQDVLTEMHGEDPADLALSLAALVDHVTADPRIREVILSGGDPLTLSRRALALVLDTLGALPQLQSIRLHTRCAVFAPGFFDKGEKIALLARPRVRLVHHIVHPYEICGEVADLLARLQAAGVRQYNQFPILRGVNDDAGLLALLLRLLDEVGVRNLSIFAPDPINHSAAFRLTLDRLFAIHDRLSAETPSWINATALTFDSPQGKFRREHLVARDRSAGTALFRHRGRDITYHDLPAALDVPGDPATMLWRGETGL
ncbi:MAG: 4Fe-4S cluster-binding domain-containing protein [Zavarzinia sp.]|nr:4Fe-4S cluster-binding domain-containing protein [Zavarzinia sp.]